MNRIIKIACKDLNAKQRLEDFYSISKITNKIKNDFFEKWRKDYLYSLVQNEVVINKPYIKLINSDLAASGSYLDSIYCDVLYGDLSTRHEDSDCIEIDRYLNHCHVFTLFIIARSIILNTAYINAYFNLKDKLDSSNEDSFRTIKEKINSSAQEGNTLIDSFHNIIGVFDLGSGDSISMLSKYDQDIKKILQSKNIISEINNKKTTDLQLVKLLECDIINLKDSVFNKEDLIILYELSSKAFHRHEFLLFIFNNWLNGSSQPTNIDGMISNTILHIVKICTLLHGYQIVVINKLLNQKDTNIIDEFSALMELSYATI
jgi:hypothetical protein